MALRHTARLPSLGFKLLSIEAGLRIHETGPSRGGYRQVQQVIGDGLRSRTDGPRATEVNVAVHALNRMLELGRPISVRIA